MALSKATLQSDLVTTLKVIFNDVFGDTDPSRDAKAEEVATSIADAIDTYVRTAIAGVTVPIGTFLVAATAGVPNPAPVPLTGDPGSGTGGLS